ETLQHGWFEKPEGIAPGIGKEKSGSQNQDGRMTKDLPASEFFETCFGLPLLREISADPVALLAGQPARFPWPVRQKEHGCYSEKNRRRAFEQKQPAPAGQTEPSDLQQSSSDWSADDETDRNSGHETRHRLSPVTIEKPMR